MEPLRERSEPLRKKRHSSDVYVPYYADLLRRSVAQICCADWLRRLRYAIRAFELLSILRNWRQITADFVSFYAG